MYTVLRYIAHDAGSISVLEEIKQRLAAVERYCDQESLEIHDGRLCVTLADSSDVDVHSENLYSNLKHCVGILSVNVRKQIDLCVDIAFEREDKGGRAYFTFRLDHKLITLANDMDIDIMVTMY